jgi:hypothetical protein
LLANIKSIDGLKKAGVLLIPGTKHLFNVQVSMTASMEAAIQT